MRSQEYPKLERIIFRLGGISAFIFLLYSFAAIIVMITIPQGYPSTAAECFHMLQENKFIGLLRLDILTVVVMPLYYILFFSIYQALKTEDPLISNIALFCVLAGVTIFLSGINISSVFILCEKYYAAGSEEQRQLLLAAGEAMLATDMWVNTGSIFRALLIETGALLFSLLMLRSQTFGKLIAWVGIVTHGLDLLHEIIALFIPQAAEIFVGIAGPLYIVWFTLIGIRLLKMGIKKIANQTLLKCG